MKLLRNVLMQEAESTTSSSAPASTPAPAAAPAAPAAADTVGEVDSPIDWAGESDLGDENENAAASKPAAPVAAAPAPAAAPATPAAAAQPAAAPAPAAGTEPAKSAEVPAAAAPAAPAKPAEAPPAAETPEAKATREAAEKVAEEKLFTDLVKHYALPEDMVAKLPTEPENVLPFLAARVHQSVARQAMMVVARELPKQVMAVLAYERKEQESKSAFYKAWPQLQQHEEQVMKAGELYRQMNPNATPEEAIKAIGGIVLASLNLPAAPAAAASAPAPAAQAGFVPAGASGSRTSAPPVEDNEFARLATEVD